MAAIQRGRGEREPPQDVELEGVVQIRVSSDRRGGQMLEEISEAFRISGQEESVECRQLKNESNLRRGLGKCHWWRDYGRIRGKKKENQDSDAWGALSDFTNRSRIVKETEAEKTSG